VVAFDEKPSSRWGDAAMRLRIGVLMFAAVLACGGCSRGKSTDELIEDLSSSEEADRIKAVRWLQQRKGDGPRVVPALIESLKDADADVRWSAAIGLGYFGAEAAAALPALEEAERDSDPRVREGARVAISRIQGKQ
jgi:HEAT repeat protein